MLAPPTASSATYCTSGKAQDLGRAGDAQVSICPLPSKISPFFSITRMLTWLTLSSPSGSGALAQAA